MKKILLWVVLLLLILMGIIWIQWPNSRVKFTMCDVGQGDGLVFSSGFSQMVVDVGPDNGGLNSCLGQIMPFWDKNIEVVVITHADSDHVGGLSKLLQRYKVDKVITTQAAYNKVNEILINRSKIALSWQGHKWYFGKLSAEVMWPPYVPPLQDPVGAGPQLENDLNFQSIATEDTNRKSMVVRVEVDSQGDRESDSGNSVWLAGDADIWVERRLLGMNLVTPTSILKAGHHGSVTASSEPFLTILQPRQIWVSVGKNNRYSHPSEEVLKLFNRLEIPVFRTDQVRTIKISY